ncbi:uncharacterized protein OCT59_008167 [Rhizophagus irregularis]|uniref:rRNA-processing protein EFG1 n=7 Tax=Rhizophagus irregularis TaxID=588596 RepID=A0A915Z7H8_9GLOM|nr:hypothetical protein GLOIN_2v1627653 [Rhizophagus irregularis DAOM 181602=DAOM 197198]EXX74296.1 Efg1p [Rhizophagus irregularis DAOM 197198w]UZO16791.1 hypothetical protein OCT59_008167 [Rhizophagus irregularis]POG69334.1 hypothetical protein GLOIN_2v1627653 [Rhizophagus irregularis DAOM 181602=DAOM 197198]CAB4475831.1 unnamed protein product [Rhizophagus irregularis]CAB5207979.1 unnamed protein product [Rhizophagus irregularis]|eukprot:XP_025176200.1 hypothetical protein GLOIN_2v1627653 [Rhizophagus irregularis DAOM 181602=DAOM 197198]
MPPVCKNKNKGYKKSEKGSLDTLSVTALKKKIRDTERFLKTNEKLSAKGQVSLERRLKACKLLLVERMAENKEKNMTSKYRMVKHFDRKKVERAIKKVQKQLNETRTFREKTELEKKLYELQIDFNYILYYPKNLKYLALHPTSGGDDEKMISKRNEIRQIIKGAMQSNDLESLNKRFKEEIKLQIVEKMMNNESLKKKENKCQERDKEIIMSNLSKTIDDDFFGSEDDIDKEEEEQL